ncbi:YesK family protein [Priestia megaterium]|uniref:YesK family protein n=1 Tax=Priestia megaterium TaxID=1404 RepID=UPI0020D26763|nr:YesK family protein [Priestia megaterium]MDD9791799.1 YesK family protein [Priestia megaterium]MDP1442937.1 YesK family protein [Priestia megaterium]MDP1472008.1 YesK family protein [Priestia megaterium]
MYIISIIMIAILIILSYIIGRKNSTLKYVVPLMVGILSVIVFIVSFFIGGWTGMGVGAISFTAFISSLISLIIISVVEALKGKGNKNIHQ